MRTVRHLTDADVRRLPWKNGRGITEELAIWPVNALFERGDFDWRISTAAVDEAGPFSTFTGFDRVLVVTHGDGLILTHGDRSSRVRLRRFEPYRFSGDWPTTCELPSGPIADFSVFTRRGHVNADVEVLQLARRRVREEIAPSHAFIHLLAGAVRARITGEEEPFELGPRESLWAQDLRVEEELELVGASDDAAVLVVRIGIARDEAVGG